MRGFSYNKFFSAIAAAFWILVLAAIVFAEKKQFLEEKASYEPRRVILKLKKPIPLPHPFLATIAHEDTIINSIIQQHELQSVEQLSFEGVEKNDSLKQFFENIYIFNFKNDVNPDQIARRLSGSKIVELAEPDYLFFANFEPYGTGFDGENFFDLNAEIDKINREVLISVITPLPEQLDDKTPAKEFISDAKLRETVLTDFIRRMLSDNFDFESRIKVRIFAPSPSDGKKISRLSTSDILKSLIDTASNKPDIILLQFWGYHNSKILHSAIAALNSLNRLFIAPAGEANISIPVFPAAYPEVLSVTALNEDKSKFPGANFGEYVDLCAPGKLPDAFELPDSVSYFTSPTINAAHYTAATAAVIKFKFPHLTNKELFERLIFSSDNIYDTENQAYHAMLGAGFLNPNNAVAGKIFPNIVIKNFRQVRSTNIFESTHDEFELFFEIENLSATAHQVKIRVLVSDALIKVSQEEIFLEKLGFGERFSNRNFPIKIELPSELSEEYTPQITLRLECAEGFFTQKSMRLKPMVSAPAGFKIVSNCPITLSWQKSERFQKYDIYRKEWNTNQLLKKVWETESDTIFVDEDLIAGQKYQYILVGVLNDGSLSKPSQPLVAQYVPEPEFLIEPADSNIQLLDSLRFAVALVQPDSFYNFNYHWYLRDSLVNNGKDLHLKVDAIHQSVDTLKLVVIGEQGEQILAKRWLIHHGESSEDSTIISWAKFPLQDTVLTFGDSAAFFISLEKEFREAIKFSWFLNDSLDSTVTDSIYLFCANQDMTPPETLTVKAKIPDSTLFAQWIIDWKIPELSKIEPLFFPLNDTTLNIGDTLSLRVFIPEADSSTGQFLWGKGNLMDTTQSSIFFYRADSAGIDTLTCRFFYLDSLIEKKWIIQIVPIEKFPEIDCNIPPGDTTIFIGDSILFSVQSENLNDLYFLWSINGECASSLNQNTFVLQSISADSSVPDTVELKVSYDNSFRSFRWIVHYLEKENSPPKIVGALPDSDLVVLDTDSCSFQIFCTDEDNDSLTFLWLINDSLALVDSDSIFKMNKFPENTSTFSVKAQVSDGRDTVSYVWQVINFKDSLRQEVLFFPREDTIEIALMDSVTFSVKNIGAEAQVEWSRSFFPDSVISEQDSLTYKALILPFFPEVVKVRLSVGGSVIEKNWYVFIDFEPERADSFAIKFFPDSDSIFANIGDTLNFLIQSDFSSALSIAWRLADDLKAEGDTSFSVVINQKAYMPLSLIAEVELPDTSMISHRWLIIPNHDSLMRPILLFPDSAALMSEFDSFRWTLDTSETRIDSLNAMEFVVQISDDSTFAQILSSDTTENLRIKLGDCLRSEKLQPYKYYYWRIRALERSGLRSEFETCRFPFLFVPEFSMLQAFKAERIQDGVAISWQLSVKGKCAGFNLYRKMGNEDFVKINDELITGNLNFEFFDEIEITGNDCQYKLEEISLSNRKKEQQIISLEYRAPNDFLLSQNSPNPFNSSTSFRFEIPRSTHVIIEVYNILGRKVKTLVNEKREAGSYLVYWDGIDDNGEHVGSGIYFYYMTAGDFHATNKMIVVR